ncbi:nicotinate-nucleotide--dimethylbenzimidazole phosphoribosyltransferase [Veillonella sp. R32]|uniref:nicotinate-nucleotide--dimethylbenzimidazole phosphoribosyltransferase n=1 Tax=Veillonella sp. R32 TaxID=2021312 RepID=UPI00138974E7|nr:nicotinate-nucleotide--dimethylbenzimidazole phosphoribosyltransferase [Veillonella sp. R32]KAF1682279.1 nicotinate-nucleotide--dimethylbenzimidazole phosphoribosyltransferase [Veillonella sp. R32]
MRTFTIQPLNKACMEACQLRVDNLTKPIYSLAQLEKIAVRLAGIYNVEQPNHISNSVLIFAGDTAVDGMQNHTKGQESLQAVTRLGSGHSATEAAARKLKASVHIVDVGLEQSTETVSGVINKKVAPGAKFFGKGPAMTVAEMEDALEVGFAMAKELASKGVQAVALGNVGERTLLSALAVTAAITQYPMMELLTDNECTLSIQEKAERLTATLARYELTPEKPLQILQCVGSLDIAAMVGFYLGAAENRLAVVFDNAVTGAALLVAHAINPAVMDFVFQSAAYNEPVHKAQMKFLEISPYLYYNLEIDEALGSVMGLSVVDAALHMLNDMKTFGEATVTVAEDGPGNKRQDGR